MNDKQNLLDLFPITILPVANLSTFYVVCPCCESRIDAFPTGTAQARSQTVCQLCEMSFDYTDSDIRQSEDEPHDFDSSPTIPASVAGLSFHPPISLKADNMDPNQTFSDLMEAMRTEDHDTARDLALALQNWLAKGGFCPGGHTREEVESYLASVLFRTGDQLPFSLVCWYCDAGQGIASEEDAQTEGWIEIEPAPQLLQANYLGVCPDCRGRHQS